MSRIRKTRRQLIAMLRRRGWRGGAGGASVATYFQWSADGTYGESYQERTGASATTPAVGGDVVGTMRSGSVNLISNNAAAAHTLDAGRNYLRGDGTYGMIGDIGPIDGPATLIWAGKRGAPVDNAIIVEMAAAVRGDAMAQFVQKPTANQIVVRGGSFANIASTTPPYTEGEYVIYSAQLASDNFEFFENSSWIHDDTSGAWPNAPVSKLSVFMYNGGPGEVSDCLYLGVFSAMTEVQLLAKIAQVQTLVDAASVVTPTINGLTSGNAVIGDHASITMSVSYGTISARKWGSTSGGSEYGTGTSPTDYAAGDGGALYATATVGGDDYTVSAPIIYAAAVNTLAPVVSGSTSLGDTLTSGNGTWTGATGGAYSYQWQRGGVDIGGETGTTYDIVAGDSAAAIRCVVTYTNSGGAVSANSNAVTVDTFAAPAITGVPTISGTETVGQTLTATAASPVTGNPTPTRTWQWVNSASGDIGGATSSTYTLQASDEGDTITVRQIETNGITPAATATSTATGAIAAAPTAAVITDVTAGTIAAGELPVEITATGDLTGSTVYLVMVPSGDTAPTDVEIAAGQESGGGAPLASGSGTWDSVPNITLPTAINETVKVYAVIDNGALSNVGASDAVAVNTTVPAYASSVPADGGTDIAIASTIVLTFDQTIVAGSGTFTLYDVTGTAAEETFTVGGAGDNGGTIGVSGTDVTLTPGASMANSNDYSVRWSAGAAKGSASYVDVAANATDTLVNFTTVSGSGAMEGDTSVLYWYAADDTTLSGSDVTSINDKSGGGPAVGTVPATAFAPTQPGTPIVFGRTIPSVIRSGNSASNRKIKTELIDNVGEVRFFMVVDASSLVNAECCSFSEGNAFDGKSYDFGAQRSAGGFITIHAYAERFAEAYSTFYVTDVAASGMFIVEWLITQTNVSLILNGVTKTTIGATASRFPTYTTGEVTLGARNTTAITRPATMDFYELFSTSDTDGTLAGNIRTQLATKYGITI